MAPFLCSTGKGRTPAKGDIFKNPALANTLRLIGDKGRDAFYKGEIADKIDIKSRTFAVEPEFAAKVAKLNEEAGDEPR